MQDFFYSILPSSVDKMDAVHQMGNLFDGPL